MDPRPTRQQRRVLETPGVEHIGTDARNRPVVRGPVGIPSRLHTWALKRDGDPTDPADPVTPLPDRPPTPRGPVVTTERAAREAADPPRPDPLAGPYYHHLPTTIPEPGLPDPTVGSHSAGWLIHDQTCDHFCNCAGCTLGTGHCHGVTCGQ